MKKHIFIGVDGGATKSIIRMESAEGQVLGQVLSGPASIRHSVNESWQSIQSGIDTLFTQLQIKPNDDYALHIGLGLAGCELPEAYAAFCATPHSFSTLMLTSDAHVACLGAHGGEDGAIIIAGTGVVGYQIHQNRTQQVGGWGFPHDDVGGGAWLGMQAVRATLYQYDKRMHKSLLADKVYVYFEGDIKKLITWANLATPRLFATLAPLVIEASQEGDPFAVSLMRQAAASIEQIYAAFAEKLPCTLVGSIALFLVPYLSQTCRAALTPARLTPDAGAILMVKQRILNTEKSES